MVIMLPASQPAYLWVRFLVKMDKSRFSPEERLFLQSGHMELHLTPDTNTSELKESFSVLFPYLRLEFFHKPHDPRAGSPKRDMYKGDHPLKQVGFKVAEGQLQISPEMRLADFERVLFDDFGLCVQVFRKSGKVWLETSATDHLSLGSQNELGKEKDTPVASEPRTEIDLNEQP